MYVETMGHHGNAPVAVATSAILKPAASAEKDGEGKAVVLEE